MFKLNLFLEQVAKLELKDVQYTLHGRNADGITFSVEFPTDTEFTKALTILLGR